MRKGQSLYDQGRSPIYFIPQPIPIIPEVFVDVTEQMVPDVRDYYMISNYGRLFQKYRNAFLSVNIDSKGYLYKPLATKSGKMKNVRIHRLVMMGFCYFPGCEYYLVNHKDGNKCNPMIWNLEWSTYSENALHAINTELNIIDEKYDENTIRGVCELLENQSNSINYIAHQMNVSYSMVSSIQCKRTHTDISDQYNIKRRKIANNLTIDEVNVLCQWFSDNPRDPSDIYDLHCIKALNAIGYPDPNSRLIRTAKKIYTKETYRYVSNNYNF